MRTDERFSRHLDIFGEIGQVALATTDVTVVGASGLGTPTLLYLAFLGPKRLRIIEPGYLKDSGRNRNFAAHDNDPTGITRKVDIAARMVRVRSPATKVDIIADRLESQDAFDAIQASEYAIGCVDQDGARFVLNELCLAFEKTLIDMATDVQAEAAEFGGRIAVVRPGEGCLCCLDLLDPVDVRRYLSSSGELDNEAAAYGVPKSRLAAQTGPSVATINGVVAGLGVTEFWAAVTGIRPTHRLTTYLGLETALRKSADVPDPDCYYCRVVKGSRHRSGVQRHINARGIAA